MRRHTSYQTWCCRHRVHLHAMCKTNILPLVIDRLKSSVRISVIQIASGSFEHFSRNSIRTWDFVSVEVEDFLFSAKDILRRWWWWISYEPMTVKLTQWRDTVAKILGEHIVTKDALSIFDNKASVVPILKVGISLYVFFIIFQCFPKLFTS